jgi:diacylglycerol kinase (ATP)
MTDLFVIANGKLQNGRGARPWHRVETCLRESFGNQVEIRFTSDRGDAARIARAALLAGSQWLAAAGGDGTLNEVANGFFDGEMNVRPESALSLLPCGSGNDFARTLGLPPEPWRAAVALRQSQPRRIDAGIARFRAVDGAAGERIFLNIAEAGVGGRLVALQNGRPDWSPAAYRLGAIRSALSCRPFPLDLSVDGSDAARTPALSLIVAGGCYFGHGMHCAPMARLDDGLLETIVVGPFGRLEILRKIRKLFSGTYLSESKVTHRSGRTVHADSADRVFLELDGEMAGTLPASFTVLPSALVIR